MNQEFMMQGSTYCVLGRLLLVFEAETSVPHSLIIGECNDTISSILLDSTVYVDKM